MKKLLAVLSIVALAACSNPEVARPFVNGPTYYKQHQCYYKTFPKSYKSWNSKLGVYDIYIRDENSSIEICNYNKLYEYGEPSLMNVYR